MTKIYSSNDGFIVRFLETDNEEAIYGPPPNYIEVLEFDPDTNANLVSDLHRSTDNYRLISGVLTKSGQVVTIQPESSTRTDLKQLATIRDGLRTYYNLSNPTNTQTAQAVKGIIRVLGIILDIYLKSR